MNPLRHQLKSRKYFHRGEGWVELERDVEKVRENWVARLGLREVLGRQ